MTARRRRGAAIPTAPQAPSSWPRSRRSGREHGIEVRIPDARARAPISTPTGLDVVISLGGDGTMLRAVDLAYEAGVPVLGVNVGQLGYLTEVEPPGARRSRSSA